MKATPTARPAITGALVGYPTKYALDRRVLLSFYPNVTDAFEPLATAYFFTLMMMLMFSSIKGQNAFIIVEIHKVLTIEIPHSYLLFQQGNIGFSNNNDIGINDSSSPYSNSHCGN
jgi:hypothetical protein